MGKERKSKKLSISEKAQKIMEEINEKVEYSPRVIGRK